MSGLRSVSEVVAALAKQYDGPIKQVQGSGGKQYDYISWDDAVRQMDAVFGPTGWSSEPGTFEGHPREGIYLATVRITARALDDETGAVIEFARDGFGRGVARASRSEMEETGSQVSRDLSIHDTAASTAGSDAFSRATKKLGDAFGLYLYQKKQGGSFNGGSAGRSAGNSGGSTGNGGAPATDAQKGLLRKKGVSEDEIAKLSKWDASKLIDSLSNGGRAPAAAGSRSGGYSSGQDSDDIPF